MCRSAQQDKYCYLFNRLHTHVEIGNFILFAPPYPPLPGIWSLRYAYQQAHLHFIVVGSLDCSSERAYSGVGLNCALNVAPIRGVVRSKWPHPSGSIIFQYYNICTRGVRENSAEHIIWSFSVFSRHDIRSDCEHSRGMCTIGTTYSYGDSWK